MVKHSFAGFWISLMQSSEQLFLDVTYCKNAKVRYGSMTCLSKNVTEVDRHWTSMARYLRKAIRCMAKAASIRDVDVGPRIAVVRHWIEMAGVWAKNARAAATEAMAIINDNHIVAAADAIVPASRGRSQPEQPPSLDQRVVNEGVTQQPRAMAMFGEFPVLICFPLGGGE